ncbi:unnamed protein product [Gadus morhua 'NCC']
MTGELLCSGNVHSRVEETEPPQDFPSVRHMLPASGSAKGSWWRNWEDDGGVLPSRSAHNLEGCLGHFTLHRPLPSPTIAPMQAPPLHPGAPGSGFHCRPSSQI